MIHDCRSPAPWAGGGCHGTVTSSDLRDRADGADLCQRCWIWSGRALPRHRGETGRHRARGPGLAGNFPDSAGRSPVRLASARAVPGTARGLRSLATQPALHERAGRNGTATRATAAALYEPSITEETFKTAHSAGFKVMAWTVNDVERARELEDGASICSAPTPHTSS